MRSPGSSSKSLKRSMSLKPPQETRELIQQGPLRVWTLRFEDEEDPLESQPAQLPYSLFHGRGFEAAKAGQHAQIQVIE